MTHKIILPALTPTMTEGTLARWLVAPGAVVAAGSVVAEVETDKTVMEIVAFEEGVIDALLVEPGATVPVHTALALVKLRGGEQVAATASSAIAVTIDAAPMVAMPASLPGGRSPLASPAARRLARERGLSLTGIHGSGPHGRVVSHDVNQRAVVSAASVEAPWHRVPLTPMRRLIAERLTRAKQEVPHFYLRANIQMQALLALRATAKGGGRTASWSLGDAFVKAAALAIRAVPAANVQYRGDHLRRLERIDVSVAVAVEGGIWTPVIVAADGKALALLAEESRRLIERARAGRLLPPEYQGGTLTVSNLGMHGIEEFAAIISPPQAMILAIGAVTDRPVRENGEWSTRPAVTVTLSVDHRAIDGVTGSKLLAAFRQAIESPARLL